MTDVFYVNVTNLLRDSVLFVTKGPSRLLFSREQYWQRCQVAGGIVSTVTYDREAIAVHPTSWTSLTML